MDIKNIKTELRNAPIDKKAGIKLIKLTGDFDTTVFAAEIPARTTLNPHFHKHGIEIYQILEGEGTMKTGNLENNNVILNEIFNVRQGDCFCINEMEVHQIVNNTDNPLVAIFTCSASHIGNDRYFVSNIGD